jgi:hypothetical protein
MLEVLMLLTSGRVSNLTYPEARQREVNVIKRLPHSWRVSWSGENAGTLGPEHWNEEDHPL